MKPVLSVSLDAENAAIPRELIDQMNAVAMDLEQVILALCVHRVHPMSQLRAWPGAFHAVQSAGPGAVLALRALAGRLTWKGADL